MLGLALLQNHQYEEAIKQLEKVRLLLGLPCRLNERKCKRLILASKLNLKKQLYLINYVPLVTNFRIARMLL